MTVTEPTGIVAELLYEAVAPVSTEDAANGYASLILVNAVAAQLDDVAELVLPAADSGLTAWEVIGNLDDTPDEWVPWLGQFVGVPIRDGVDPEVARDRVRARDGWRRGRPAAIVAAAQEHLTGSRIVVLRERYDPADPGVDSPYHLTVYTFTPETPDDAVVEAAVRAVKPIGLVLHYEMRDGQDYQSVDTTYADYAALDADVADYAELAATYD